MGVPVASHLSPEPNRLKPTRRFKANKTVDVSPNAPLKGTSNAAVLPLRQVPISDDEFMRRLIAEKNEARRKKNEMGAASNENGVEPGPRRDLSKRSLHLDNSKDVASEGLAFGRAARKRSLSFAVVILGLLLPTALFAAFWGWSLYIDSEIKREGRPSVPPREPIFLDGALTFRTSNGRVEGDDGAFVFLFPTDGDFGDSLALGDLAPGRKFPPRFDEFLAKLEKRGGYFTVAEFDGRFAISLKNPGEYDVLLVSRNVEGTPSASDAAALKEISRYLYLPEQKLLAKRRFLWKRQTFDRDSAVVDENLGTQID